MGRRPWIIAHAGCENTVAHTIESVLEGYRAGADMAEIDLRATADGVVVLQHDARILAGGRLVSVGKLSYSELASLMRDGNGGTGLVRFDEVLEAVRAAGGTLNLDAKEDAVIEPAAKLIKQQRMEEVVVFTGCEAERARMLRSRHPSLQALLNPAEKDYRQSKKSYGEFARAICSEAVECGCAGINMDFRFCTEELVRHAASRFLPVCVWTVDKPADQKRILALGTHGITTRQVRALSALFA